MISNDVMGQQRRGMEVDATFGGATDPTYAIVSPHEDKQRQVHNGGATLSPRG